MQGLSSLGSVAGLLAVASCYGALAAVSLFSLIGVSVDVDEAILVKLITGLLIVALLGMLYSWHSHRYPGPLLLSLGAAGLLFWVFYGNYSKSLELTGFVLLIIASVWDFRAKRRICADRCHGEHA